MFLQEKVPDLITTQNLSYSYTGSQSFTFPDLQLKPKECLLVLGKSGKGKTTFLHLLSGLLSTDSGNILIDQIDISKLNSKKLDRFRGDKIGLVFQKPHFIKSLNVKDNLLLAQKLGGLNYDLESIKKVLEQLGIADKLNSAPSQLSIGEQQRASIARAVLNKPVLLLADEPTSALDDENAHKVAELLEWSAKECNASLIIVTHDSRLKSRFPNSVEI